MNGRPDEMERIAALAEARRRGAVRLAQWQDALPDPFSPAALEFAKAGLGEGEIRCGSEDAGSGHRGRLFALRYFGLAIVAWFAVLFALCRYPGSGGRISGKRVVALHGEVSNRTRHLLEAIKAGEPADAVLVLGLPQCSLIRLRTTWAPWLGGTDLALRRPVSVVALLNSIPVGYRAVVGAYQLATSCPVPLPSRALAAILARLWLGQAHARWWARNAGAVEEVSYGHTGTADTSQLELAQQAKGATTLHIVHGVSAGRNFLGLSNVALWQCGHDADWHARLGGYGRNEWRAADRPAFRCGEHGLLVLSNFAHPMNLGYRLAGISEEVSFLKEVADAARRVGVGGPWLWQPHPASRLLPADQFRSLAELANDLGFQVSTTGRRVVELALASRWVVSSESTAVIELMREGIAPVMYPSRWGVVGAALSAYPICASDPASLVSALKLPAGDREQRFRTAWDSIRPAMSRAQLLEESRRMMSNVAGAIKT